MPYWTSLNLTWMPSINAKNYLWFNGLLIAKKLTCYDMISVAPMFFSCYQHEANFERLLWNIFCILPAAVMLQYVEYNSGFSVYCSFPKYFLLSIYDIIFLLIFVLNNILFILIFISLNFFYDCLRFYLISCAFF